MAWVETWTRAAGARQHQVLDGLMRRASRAGVHVVDVDGVRTPVLITGEGPALVCLHGFADRKETWAMLLPLLRRRYRVIAPDLPGYGGADRVGLERLTLEAQARFVVGLLDALGIERAHLCGNSMGGGVALRVASEAPERVMGLFLLSSIGPVIESSVLLSKLNDEGVNLLLPTTADEWEVMFDHIFVRRPVLPRAMRRFMAARHVAELDYLAPAFDMLLDVTQPHGVPEALEAIDRPALVIHGRQDNVVHSATARALARRLPTSHLCLLDNVGHAPHWERPAWTVRAMRRFAREHGYA